SFLGRDSFAFWTWLLCSPNARALVEMSGEHYGTHAYLSGRDGNTRSHVSACDSDMRPPSQGKTSRATTRTDWPLACSPCSVASAHPIAHAQTAALMLGSDLPFGFAPVYRERWMRV